MVESDAPNNVGSILLIVTAIPCVAVGAAWSAGARACATMQQCADDASLACSENTALRMCSIRACKPTIDPLRAYFIDIENAVSTSVLQFEDIADTQAALTLHRGACAPGMRHILNGEHSNTNDPPFCMVQLSYPSAMVRDAMDMRRNPMSERACGRWIDALTESNAQIRRGTSFAFLDSALIGKSMWLLAERRTGTAGILVPHAATKLVHSCRGMLDGNVADMLRSMRIAHAAIRRDAPHSVNSPRDLALFIGVLGGYACPGAIQLHTVSSPSGYQVSIAEGQMPSAEAVVRSMRLLSLAEHVIDAARSGLEWMERPNIDSDCSQTTDRVTHELIEALIEGLSAVAHRLSASSVEHRRSLASFNRLLCMVEAAIVVDNVAVVNGENSEYVPGQDTLIESIMAGLTAECVAVMADRMIGPDGISGQSAPTVSLESPEVTSLGRTRRWSVRYAPTQQQIARAFETPSEAEWRRATGRTLTRLSPAENKATEHDSCFEALRYAAVDAAESQLFSAVVPHSLYQRLAWMVSSIRENTMQMVTTSPFSNVFADVPSIVAGLSAVRVRFSGAPSGSWAGVSRPTQVSTGDFSDGPIFAYLSQLREQTKLNLHTVFDTDRHACDVPPLFEATEANAYYLHGADCIVISLALLHMPIADQAYDDISLLGRIGFVIAHEMAHVTLHSPREEVSYLALLEHYSPASTHEEALADVLAMAVLRRIVQAKAPQISCNETMLHMAQLFCALPDHAIPTTHPMGNGRVDLLVRTMREKLPHLC